MPDRKKYIEVLSKTAKTVKEFNEDVPIKISLECAEDILELLKEQEAVKPVRDERTGRLWLCGNCGSYVGFEDHDEYDPNEFDKFCRECGKPVLWEGQRSE